MRLDPGDQGQNLVFGANKGQDAGHFGPAGGQGARLVEGKGAHLGQGFQRAPALEKHAAAGGCRKGREDRSRHRDHYGAGAGCDQKRRGAVEGVIDRPAKADKAEKEQDRSQQHGNGVALTKPIGKPLGRGFHRLGFGHQGDHPGDGGFRHRTIHPHRKDGVQVYRGLVQAGARRFQDGDGFTRDAGFVQRSFAFEDRAINRNARPRAQDHRVPHDQFGDWHLGHRAVSGAAQGTVGPEGHERLDSAAGLAHGAMFQRGRQAEQRQQDRAFKGGVHRCGSKGCNNHEKVDVEDMAAVKFGHGAQGGGQATRDEHCPQGDIRSRARQGDDEAVNQRHGHSDKGQKGQKSAQSICR